MLCWMNGQYIKAEELQISPFDHGFLYGAGFFETFRTYEGQIILFDEHFERLHLALEEFRIKMPYTKEQIKEAVAELDRAAGNTDGYFRLNVSAGVHDIGLAPSEYKEPTVILFRKALAKTVRGQEKQGVWLSTPRNQPESAMRHKSHNYLNNVRGRLELTSLKDKEGIFLTAAGHVAEGVTSNVFWVKEGELYTPSLATGILPGTTRAYVLTLAAQLGITVHEGLYMREDVLQADEVFVTNAVQELVPLSTIDETKFAGMNGSVYSTLHQQYLQAITAMKEG